MGILLWGVLRPYVHEEVVSTKNIKGITPILIGGFLVIYFLGFVILFLLFLMASYLVGP